MENWRPVAGWSLGAVALVALFVAVQAQLNSVSIRAEHLGLIGTSRLNESWLENSYDWNSFAYLCLVAGEATLAAWFLGKGTRILPRDTHPILPCAGAGLLLCAVVLASLVWVSVHLPH